MSPGMGGYSSIGDAVRKMVREEGTRGFYKGLFPNLLKVNISKDPDCFFKLGSSVISFLLLLNFFLLP
jgi:hypothetical protein